MSTGRVEAVGRRRRQAAAAKVTVVLETGGQHTLPADAPLARVMAAVAGLLAHW